MVEIQSDTFKEMQDYITHINNTPIRSIKIIHEGKEIPISNKIRNEWRFTGLNNVHFIQTVLKDVEQGLEPLKDLS